MHHLEECDVFLVFDRYVPDSVKYSTRISRADNTLDKHRLQIGNLLPAKNVFLKVTENKLQLIELMSKHLPELMKVQSTSNHLVIYGQQDDPLDICNGIVINQRDLMCNHEEADVTMIPFHTTCKR